MEYVIVGIYFIFWVVFRIKGWEPQVGEVTCPAVVRKQPVSTYTGNLSTLESQGGFQRLLVHSQAVTPPGDICMQLGPQLIGLAFLPDIGNLDGVAHLGRFPHLGRLPHLPHHENRPCHFDIKIPDTVGKVFMLNISLIFSAPCLSCAYLFQLF